MGSHQRKPTMDATPSLPAHRVSALYSTLDEAKRIQTHLQELGIAARDMELLDDARQAVQPVESDEILKDMLMDGAIGTAVGTGVGAVGTAMLWAGSITLFVASPLIAPLAMLGWFASVGGIVGAVAGAAKKEGRFSELVMDTIKSGSVVLVVHTRSEAEKALVMREINLSLVGQEANAQASPETA